MIPRFVAAFRRERLTCTSRGFSRKIARRSKSTNRIDHCTWLGLHVYRAANELSLEDFAPSPLEMSARRANQSNHSREGNFKWIRSLANSAVAMINVETKNGTTIVQGCGLNWERIKARLHAETADVIEQSEWRPITGESRPQTGRILATVPVELVVDLSSIAADFFILLLGSLLASTRSRIDSFFPKSRIRRGSWRSCATYCRNEGEHV